MIIDSVAYDLGLQNGDKLVALDGKKIERFDNFQKDMLLKPSKRTND
jgi:membrane-associated protease RseP (regulator of RpoE activity)